MSREGNRPEKTTGTGSGAPVPGRAGARNRAMAFDCCGAGMGDGVAGCPCIVMMRRHPLVALLLLGLMGLLFLAIPTGVILGIIAFMKTI